MDSTTALFELLAALAAFVAAVFILDQHLNRPRPYKLLWSLGLLFYGIAAFAAFAGARDHWTVGEYKTWYYFGGVLTAAFLGLGSLWLLGPKRLARALTAVAVVLALYAAVRIATYDIGAAAATKIATSTTADVTNVGKFKVLPGDLTAVAILMNIPGALLLFGGAVWSGWQFWRTREAQSLRAVPRRVAPGYRVVSMGLLALGSVFPSILTGLQRLGYSGGAALGELLGALCLLAGLLTSLDVFTVFRVPFTRIVLHERKAAEVARSSGR